MHKETDIEIAMKILVTFIDNSDYEVQCICHGGSGCNLHDDPDLVDSIVTGNFFWDALILQSEY